MSKGKKLGEKDTVSEEIESTPNETITAEVVAENAPEGKSLRERELEKELEESRKTIKKLAKKSNTSVRGKVIEKVKSGGFTINIHEVLK